MKKNYHHKLRVMRLLISFLIIVSFGTGLYGQSFSQNALDFNGYGSIGNGTSLMFGPDNRLYVAEYTGAIKIFTIERISSTSYKVVAAETLTSISTIQDHNDDGSLYTSNLRETTGLTVGGTANNPVIYVTSSDFRIGGGGGGGSGDTNLDTNSGIITRFSWNGNSWDVVDLVRGLPRSEENHATNGLEIANIKGVNYLIVAQGGHTNAGAPSVNFAYTTEYALSASILSVNLDMINSMPIKTNNGRKYIYDLPTLDDPTRANKNGITNPDTPGYDGVDINDPFGGNDGLNQAKIVPGGPVQIFSPGYRNCFDLVLTENGAIYVTENGSNGGWGGFPVNEGGGFATNDYDPAEPGSTVASGGEMINNKDHLQLVTFDIQNYTFGSFYGGHPAPVRANPTGAGLYTNPSINGNAGAVFRTKKYHPLKNTSQYTSDPNIALPADWPPVPTANPVEGDWRGPGIPNPDGPVDDIITTWGTNTNGIDEYTASNFNGAMKGDLIAGVNTGILRRVELKPDGSLEKLTLSFVSGLGGDALGVTCNGDNDIFPGTIWVVTLNGKLIVLEPQDFLECKSPGDLGYDANADYDHDGYTNQDEEDNGTDPCNGGSQPDDFDKSDTGANISDLNDLDDDNDGIPDANDVFQLGDPKDSGSDAFMLPVTNELFSSNTELDGYKGLGFTGLMNNGAPNPNWLNWLDRRDDPNDPNENDILGGAIGAMTMQMTSGTALGTSNNQEKGFQYGIQVNSNSGIFTVDGGITNFNSPVQLYGTNAPANGELGFFIGDGTQSNYIKFVITPSGLIGLQEINDILQTPIELDIPLGNRPNSSVNFYFIVNPTNGEVILKYALDAGSQQTLGSFTAQGPILQAIQNGEIDLAVGLIGTSNAAGVEVEGTWDYLNVTSSGPVILETFPDLKRNAGAPAENISLLAYFDDNEGKGNLTYSISGNSNTAIGAVISGSSLALNYPGVAGETQITIRATDSDLNFAEQSFKVSVLPKIQEILYRVNAGGPAITSIDGKMAWGEDTSTKNSAYLTYPGLNSTFASGMTSYIAGVDRTTTPVSIYDTERFDREKGEPNMTYSFPVDKAGTYEVRLYMGNGYSGTATAGKRIFDVSLEGTVYPALDNIDLAARFGHQVGSVIIQEVEVTDGVLEISFIHGAVENPLINGIEILGAAAQGAETPIVVNTIGDQFNSDGDVLDGSLAVSANGGDGNLSYSISGAPAGVNIEPTNGQIGGTISSGASLNSPYTVTVSVDDSDTHTDDKKSVSFKWTIGSGAPTISKELPDLIRNAGAPAENISLVSYFDDNEGKGNLTYSISGNSNTAIGAVISGSSLALNYPGVAGETQITIRATDSDLNFVEQSFKVSVLELVTGQEILYRVNTGGSAITSIDGKLDWGADTKSAKSAYLSQAGMNNTYASGGMTSYNSSVDQATTPVSIFNTERYDSGKGEPNMTYSFPVKKAGTYEVRLYMGNGYSGTATAGKRIFDVSLEGTVYPALDNIDLAARFGHQVGSVIIQEVEVTDGVLEISFIHGAVENPLINGIEILGAAAQGAETPIVVNSIGDQFNSDGDVLDGSLAVSANGGDGNLSYSISGAPAGVSIEPTNGQIGGTISSGASLNSPYTVTVSVDDSDTHTDDKKSVSFKWTIGSGAPTISKELPDLIRNAGAPAENISLVSYFDDNEGKGNLTYSISGNSNTAIGAVISGSSLALNYPGVAGETQITIRATDSDLNFVEQSFKVSVLELATGQEILYRVNTGGSAITSIDGKLDWGADTKSAKSAYLSQAGMNNTYASGGMTSYNSSVDQATTPVSIFNTERYDSGKGEPNMTYSFPVKKAGTYEVRLYMGNGYSGTATAGKRIFDVSLEGTVYPAFDNIDLAARFGHRVGSVIIQEVEVTDGVLEISFIHGAVENPLINGIEILGAAAQGAETPIVVNSIGDQFNSNGDVLDGSLVVSANGGDGNLSYSISGAPAGVIIEPTNGQIGGTISSGASLNSPYTVTVSVDDSDTHTDDKKSVSFKWTINESTLKWIDKNENENYTARHECSFVQAGDKFYLLGGRENAKTIDKYDYNSNSWISLTNSAPFEFNHFQATEYQGLIWVIGAFGDNNYPTEKPEEFIWIFNPATENWIQGPEIPQERQRGSAGLVVYNDKFYIVGGNTDGHNGGTVAWFDEYDPVNGTWTNLIDAPRARDHFHAAIVGNKLYVIGGRLSGGAGGVFKPLVSEVDVYNFTTNSWSTLPSQSNIPTPRGAPSVVNYNEKLLVIGGEVENELINGENFSGALKITEELDPQTGNWKRVEDLNHQRHGTQAIVSGQGVYILAGSPQLGGGSQKNMEYLGIDAPEGSPTIASNLNVPVSVQVSNEFDAEIPISVTDGNIGKIITSIEIIGPNKENFMISSGNIVFGLLKPNSNHNVYISYLGNLSNESASLVINYDSGESKTIALESNVTGVATLSTTSSSFAMYPNPAVDEVTIEILDTSIQVEQLYIYSSNGTLLNEYSISSVNNDRMINLDVSALATGVYIIKLKTSLNEFVNLTLIVSR